jgi:hypothetical protein
VKYEQDVLVSVRVTVIDRNVIDRCVNNEDGWRGLFYADLDSEEKVIAYLAYNCAHNGIEKANRLDGWADLADNAATMSIADSIPEGDPLRITDERATS